MMSFVNKYGKNFFSQNNEDGIISECLKRLNIKKGVCVEYGAADGVFCSNTMQLLLRGWKGLMFETDIDLYEKLKENVKGLDCMPLNQSVLPGNINTLLPENIDVLSIDTDGINDYESWFEYRGSAKIVIIEINSSVEPMNPYLDQGASYLSMYTLGVAKGYFLLCHTGNAVFLRNEYKSLFPEVKDFHPITDWEKYFNKSWL